MRIMKLIGAVFCSLLSLFSIFIAWLLYNSEAQSGAMKFFLLSMAGAGLAFNFAKQVRK